MNIVPQYYPVTCHTDHVGPGSTFVVIKGFNEDGQAYIPLALKKGATTIVIEEDVVLIPDIKKQIEEVDAQLIQVPSSRKALASLSAEAHGFPADSLKLVGITGTKGKTTTTYLLEHILRTAGIKTARLSTVKNRILDQEYDASLTTPQPDYLHQFFALCKQAGVEVVVMEVAAQALSMYRVDLLEFDAVIYTNFSLEHSEFYPTMDEYFAAKERILSQVTKDGLVVLNADDQKVASLNNRYPQATLISLHQNTPYRATVKQSTLEKLELSLETPEASFDLVSGNLLGEFSAYNILGCCAVGMRYGSGPETLQKALNSFEGVPGRLACYPLPNKARALIDNAHTPSSFEAFFKAVRPLSSDLIAVFGAGGDRDRLKRPLMGALAAEYADKIILTMDNPRSETVESITQEILAGIPHDKRYKVDIIYDREEAIKKAYAYSQEGSLILLLGKGPVEYQHIKDDKIPFSEVAILRSLRS